MLARLLALSVVAVLMQAPIVPTELEQGDQSNIDEVREAVARSDAEWTTLWRQHNPDRPRPKVDFRTSMVIAVFVGSRPTAGFAVHIATVTTAGDALIVRYRETRPKPDAMTAQVLTFPYHMIVVPTRPGRVTFEHIE